MTQKEINRIMKKGQIKLDMFGSSINVFFNRDEYNTLMRWRGHQEDFSSNGCAIHSCLESVDTKETNDHFIIGIFKDDLSTIVHEATHISLMFCDFIGHQVTKNDEIVPYLNGYIVKEIMKLKSKNA